MGRWSVISTAYLPAVRTAYRVSLSFLAHVFICTRYAPVVFHHRIARKLAFYFFREKKNCRIMMSYAVWACGTQIFPCYVFFYSESRVFKHLSCRTLLIDRPKLFLSYSYSLFPESHAFLKYRTRKKRRKSDSNSAAFPIVEKGKATQPLLTKKLKRIVAPWYSVHYSVDGHLVYIRLWCV